jgi:hypothetical protein
MADELPVPALRRALPRAGAVVIAVLGLALGAMPLQAQDAAAPRYQVEALVFLQPEGSSVERLPLTAPEPGAEAGANPGAGLFPAEPSQPEATPLLPEGFAPAAAKLELETSAAALARRGYRVLWHQAWVQPVGTRDGVDLGLLAALGQGTADPRLSGTVSLSAGRFLHLGVMLEWRPGGVLEAQMEQRRRVRPDSEHYFDHPRLGVLARVTRLQPDAGN